MVWPLAIVCSILSWQHADAEAALAPLSTNLCTYRTENAITCESRQGSCSSTKLPIIQCICLGLCVSVSCWRSFRVLNLLPISSRSFCSSSSERGGRTLFLLFLYSLLFSLCYRLPLPGLSIVANYYLPSGGFLAVLRWFAVTTVAFCEERDDNRRLPRTLHPLLERTPNSETDATNEIMMMSF